VAGGEHEERGKVVFLVLTKRFLTFAFDNYMNVKTPTFHAQFSRPRSKFKRVSSLCATEGRRASQANRPLAASDGHLDVH
jgi:hypothetical protein